MLTERQFQASLRVLEALRTPQSATIVLTWDEDMQRALAGLDYMKYTRTIDTGRHNGPFKWDRIETTPLGLTYLTQIRASQAAQRAEKKR